jgi:hypothetical protein
MLLYPSSAVAVKPTSSPVGSVKVAWTIVSIAAAASGQLRHKSITAIA